MKAQAKTSRLPPLMVLVPQHSKTGLMFAPMSEDENSLTNLETGVCAAKSVESVEGHM